MGKSIKKTSPLKLSFPKMPVIEGVKFATTNCGIRYVKRPDLLLAEFIKGTTVAGIFTNNKMPGVPVDWCRKILKVGYARALVVNSGISNVFTGKKGVETVEKTVEKTAELVGCKREEVYLSSTGIIGQPIKTHLLVGSLPGLKKKLGTADFEDAVAATNTTDTFNKGATRIAIIGKNKVKINGIIKGSGMIAPDMATMLGYIFTDAKIPAKFLQKMLSSHAENSFNSITVDSDISTSDTILLFATGAAKHKNVKSENDLKDFSKKLFEVMLELAQLVVRDGEGAKKLVEIKVKGAKTEKSARKIALSIANSPLVKTAIAAGDANWGRIVGAVGKAGEPANRDKLSIIIGGIVIAEKGAVSPAYSEEQVAPHMQGDEIKIIVDVGVGEAAAKVWTCDLTHEYIDINANYRS